MKINFYGGRPICVLVNNNNLKFISEIFNSIFNAPTLEILEILCDFLKISLLHYDNATTKILFWKKIFKTLEKIFCLILTISLVKKEL